MDETNETLDLVAIYAAIDRAVEADPDLASQISLTLPEYGEPGAHWYSAYEKANAEYVEREGGQPQEPLPSLGAALESLAGKKPLCRMRARRLLAVGSAARILAEDPSLLQAAALGGEYLEVLGEEASAERLVELFRYTPQAEDAGAALDLWWEMLLGSGQIPEPLGIGPRPCTAEPVPVEVPGLSTPATAFTTVMEAPDVPFARARNFCDPMNWLCFRCWCNMEPLGVHNSVRRYRETVSFACRNPFVLKLVVDLDFTSVDEPGAVIAEYWLSDVQPERRVLVNEGVLEVRQLGPQPDSGVWVKTTKRIKFAPPLDVPGFLLLMCRLGYLSMLEDLFCCSVDPDWNAPFPGQRPAGAGAQPRTADVPTGVGAGLGAKVEGEDEADTGAKVDPDIPCLTKDTIDEVAAAAEECVDGWAQDLKESYRKMGEKSYDADALVQDMANMWVRMVGDAANMAEIGLRTARTAPGTGRTERSGHQHSAGSTTKGEGSGIAKAIDDGSETAKELIRKWSDYAAGVSANLAGDYTADRAAADFANGVLLGIQSSARLTQQAMEAISALAGCPDGEDGSSPPGRKPLLSEEFSTGLSGAALTVKEQLRSSRFTLPASAVKIQPQQLGPNQTRFRLNVNIAGQGAGYYRGTVAASTPDGHTEDVPVHVTVP